MTNDEPETDRRKLFAAIVTALGDKAVQSTASSPIAIGVTTRREVDRDQARTAMAVLMKVPREAVTDALLDETISKIVTDAEHRADLVAGYLVSLAEHFESIDCVTADQIAAYLEFAREVLADLYLEAGRPSPSPTKLKRLALQLALDARRPIQGSAQRFELKRHDWGYDVLEYPSVAMRIPAIPIPARKVKEVYAVAVLDLVEGDAPRFWRLRKLIEQLLDREPAEPTNELSDRVHASSAGVVVDFKESTIAIHGKTYTVDLTQAYFVDAIVKANGSWLAGSTISSQNELVGQRPDRVFSKVPQAIRDVIESRGAKGYRLRTE